MYWLQKWVQESRPSDNQACPSTTPGLLKTLWYIQPLSTKLMNESGQLNFKDMYTFWCYDLLTRTGLTKFVSDMQSETNENS